MDQDIEIPVDEQRLQNKSTFRLDRKHRGFSFRGAQSDQLILEHAGAMEDAVDPPKTSGCLGHHIGHGFAVRDVGRGQHHFGSKSPQCPHLPDSARCAVLLPMVL